LKLVVDELAQFPWLVGLASDLKLND